MKPGYFRLYFHNLIMQLHSWPLLSKQKKTGGFQKCKVYCCNFKGFKVTSLQSSASLGFEPGTPSWASFPMLSDSRGWSGFKSGQAELWRLVTLKSLKLQQCTLHFWKPLIFFYLDMRGQGHSYVLITQKVFLKTPGFTIVSLLVVYISIWLSVEVIVF